MMNRTLFLVVLLSACIFGFSVSELGAQSAIRQLEDITGQRIDRGGGYGTYVSPPAPSLNQDDYNREFSDFMALEANKINNKGIDYYNQKNWAKAANQFKKASNMNPGNSVYKTNYQNAMAAKAYEDEREQKNKEIKKNDEIFVKSLNTDIKTYSSQLTGLRKSLKSYVPPLTERFPKKIHEGVMLGLFNSQTENDVKSIISPFTGKAYKEGEYFATTDDTGAKELIRGVVDNGSLGKYTLNSEHGKKLVKELSGTHFNRLVAHSNGATVSEALIREGVIEVEELNIIGGDRSLINYFGYNELVASGKVKRVVIWLNPGDVIPYGSSAGLLSPFNGAREQNAKNFADFFSYKLEGTNAGNQVEYRFLSGPKYTKGQDFVFGKGFFDAHGIDAYYENMDRFFK